MAYILNKNSSIIVDNLIETIINNTEYLSEIDGAIGDGDHGINMNKGFSICKTRLADKEVNLAEALKTLGLVLMMEIGGSMGPLYGTFFVEMSKVISDKEEIDKDVFSEMLNASLKGLQSLGNANVGDKTMMDTLVPAVEKFDQEIAEGKSFVEALQAMKTAAEKGKDSTKDLVAKVGRASRLGERSRGVLDAGAVSCNLILACIIDSVIELIEDM